MLLIRKDQVEHADTRLLVQSQINAEAGPKAFEAYVKLRYPYLETAKKREYEQTIQTLLSEVNKGPMTIKPMGTATAKSKMHPKITRTDAEPVKSQLAKKIGKAIPV